MKTRIPQAIALITGIMLWAGTAQAQFVEIVSGSPKTCPGDTQVVVPITANNSSNIGGISLAMLFDTTVLVYDTFINQHPALSGIFLVNSPAVPGNSVLIAWFGLTPVNIPSIKIVDLVFHFKGGTANFGWSTGLGDNSIVDTAGLELPTIYTNGTIQPAPPVAITSSPTAVTTNEYLNVSFTATATNAFSYQWQVSADNGVSYQDAINNVHYSGVTTNNLQITNVPFTFDGNLYRCIAFNQCGFPDTSGAALLTVICIPPSPFIMLGGGVRCNDGIGIEVGLSGSATDVVYKLYRDAVYTGQTIPGTGNPISFGLQTTAGAYTAVGVKPLCDSTFMTGIANVIFEPLPIVYNVTGGGVLCNGDPGFEVGLNLSESGVNYILYRDGVSTGDTLTGGAAPFSFGLQTVTGTYSIKAITAVGCAATMTGSVDIVNNPLPQVFTVSGGGGYCTGGAGVDILLSGSETGMLYELMLFGNPTAIFLSGTGMPLTYTGILASGTYTVQATNIVTGCQQMMASSADVDIYPLPVVTFALTGPYCFNHVPVILTTGAPIGGTYTGNGITPGSIFDPALAGIGSHEIIYTFTNAFGCISADTQHIDVLNIPAIYNVTGGGIYCPTVTAPSVGLDGSETAASYMLYLDGVLVSTIAGTGAAISFGPQALAGTYTVMASFGSVIPVCSSWMTGSVVVAILPLDPPTASTNSVSAITTSSAMVEGTVGLGCGNPITQRGFVYSTSPAPTLADMVIVDPVNGIGTFSLTISGLAEGITVYVRAFATNTEGTTYGNELNFTTLITPAFVTLALEESTDKIIWKSLAGNLVSGFNLTLDPNAAYHYLNVEQAGTTLNVALQAGYYGFTVASYPAGFFAYWDGRGVNASALAGTWQATMWQIINGNLPTFYLKVNPDGSLMLVDGLMYALGQPDDYLRVDWNYLLGDYTYVGTFNSIDGVTSAPFTVGISFVGKIPMFTSLSLESSIDKVVWTPVSGSLNLGFSLLLDSTVNYYYLNFENPQSQVNFPLMSGYHPFFITANPPDFFTYWDGRGVNAGAVAGTWQAVMWQIINGNQPIFFVKQEANGDLMIVDGLLHLLGQPDEYLRINGGYLPGNYSFTGTLTGINNLVSAPVVVGMTLTRACIPVAIVVEPVGTTVCAGTPAVFTVQANGSSPLAFQWRFNGVDIPGTNSATLTLSNVTLANAGTYSCFVSNDCGNALSVDISLTVNPLPVITSQPQYAFTHQGNPVTFNITAANASTYQWQVSTNNGGTWSNISNGLTYAGVNTTSLTVLNPMLTMNGYLYRCVASGICAPPAVSTGGIMLVTLPTAGIITTAGSALALPGDTVVIPIDVQSFYGVSAIALTLTYDPGVASFVEYRNPAAEIMGAPILVNAINGEVRMQWFSVVPANAGNKTLIEFVFVFQGGYTALTWKLQPKEATEYGDVNGLTVPAIWINGSINEASSMTILTQPTDAVTCIGTSAMFSVTASGANTYQWQVSSNGGASWTSLGNNAIYSGATTAQLNISAVSTAMNNYAYRCVLGDGINQITSNAAILTVSPWAYLNMSIAASPGLTVCAGTPITFSLPGDSLLTLPAYAWYLNGVAVSTAPTYTLVSPASGDQVSLSIVAVANCAATNINPVEVVVDPVPQILSQTTSIIGYEQDTVHFEVQTTTNVSYQWQVSTDNGVNWTNVSNTAPYAGANASVLTVNGLLLGMHGNHYRCIVTENLCGFFVTSAPIPLTVKQLPIYTYIGSLTACAGDLVTVPVTADNFMHVASASLRFTYDTTVLSFVGFQNVDPAFNNGFLFINQFNDQISVSYFGMPPLNIGSGLLFEVLFTYKGGTTNLSWDPTFGLTMYTNVNGQVLEAYFTDGQISSKPLPVAYQVTGGGQYCIGGTGVAVGLDNSDLGFDYELFLDGNPTGQILSGTGSALSFGNQLLAGSYTVFATNIVTGCVNFMNGSVNVVILPLPVVTLTLAQDAACIDAAPVVLNGGNPAGGIFSGPGVAAGLFDPTIGAGNYVITYTYTDINGCVDFATDTFTVHPLPVLAITPAATAICYGESVTLTASGGNTYLWSTTETTAAITVSPLITTTYTVTAFSAFGCQVSDNVTVTVNPLPVVSIAPAAPVICFGDTAVLTALGAVTYAWNTGELTASISVAPGVTTTYSVTGTDGLGCASSATVVVTVNPLPVIVVNPSPVNICYGESVALLASGAVSYVWDLGDTTAGILVSPLVTTTYTVTGTDINGCQSVGTGLVIVDPLPFVYNVTGGGAYCANASGLPVGLDQSQVGITYTLYLDGIATTQTVAGNGLAVGFGNQMLAGIYTVMAENDLTGCKAMMAGNAVITIDPLPIVTLQPTDVTLDIGFTASFTASMAPVAAYQWQVSMNGGLSWIDIVDGGMYAGALSGNLTVGPVPFSVNGYLFRLVGTNGTCVVTSNAALLNVNPVIPTLTTTASNELACPGDTVIIPVVVSNANFMSAFDIYMSFDPTVAQLIGYQNIHPSLAVGTLTPVPGLGNLQATWTSGIPVFIGNGTLVELIFHYTAGNTTLNWGMNSTYLNGFGDTIPSSYINGSIMPKSYPPVITASPVDVNVLSGTNASFSVSATGASTYQWQVSFNGGASWANVVDGLSYSGATTVTLQVLATPLGFDGNQYRCIVFEPICGLNAASAAATLHVFPSGLPVITSLPTQSICPGNPILVPVSIQNFYNITSASLNIVYDTTVLVYTGYQLAHPQLSTGVLAINPLAGTLNISWNSLYPAWITNNTLVVLAFDYVIGNTTLNFTTTGPGASQYRDPGNNLLVATFNNGAVNQASYPPVVTTDPADQYVLVGSNPTFSVAGTGYSSIQWQRSIDGGLSWVNLVNNIFYSGVHTATLTITNAQLGMDGDLFRAILTEGLCNLSTASMSALLNVVPFNPVIYTHIPTLVTCPDTVILPVHVQNIYQVYGFNLRLNHDINNLQYVGFQNAHSQTNPGTLSVTPQSGHININWTSTTPASILNGTLMELIFVFNGGVSPLAWNTALAGSSQYVNQAGIPYPSSFTSGSISTPGPILNGHPAALSLTAGSPATFQVSASNVSTYQWQISTNNGATWSNLSNTGAYSGVTTNTLQISAVTLAMNGDMFRVVLSGVCQDITSNPATLTVNTALAKITTMVGTSTSCAGPVSIPIRVTNFINVASFNLAMWYNTDSMVLNYLNYTNVHPALTAGGLLTVSSVGDSVIYFSWTATSGGITIGSDSLLVLQFTGLGGNTNLRWNTEVPGLCNYLDPLGFSFPQQYNNGSIIVYEFPKLAVIPTGPTFLCKGSGPSQYTTSKVSYASSYAWSLLPANAGTVMGNDTSVSIVWNSNFTGTATLSVAGVNNCGNGPASPALTITIDGIPGQAAAPTGPLSLCVNSPNTTYNTTGATNAGTYQWTISPANAGTITGTGPSAIVDWNNTFTGYAVISVRGINSCGSGLFSNGLLVTIHPNPVVNLGPDIMVCASQTVTLNAGISGASYLWSTGATTQSITFGITGYGLGTHAFSVTVTNSQGCSGSDAINVTFDPCVGIADLALEPMLQIYPNPNTGRFTVDIENLQSDNAELQVMNLLGEILYRNAQIGGATQQSLAIELNGVPAGVYFLRLLHGDKMIIRKIIVQR